MSDPSYAPRRKCESCGAGMSPWIPRRRHDDGRLLCRGCASGQKESNVQVQANPLPPSYHTRVQGPYNQHPTGPAEPVGSMDDAIHDMLHRMNVQHTCASFKRVAHDSGDGETIFHCPFCGSGAVTAGGDGTVSCDYCKTNFTVQVQPEFSAFPQTVNGQPYDVPGMPNGTPSVPAADPTDPNADPNADPAKDNPFDKGEQQGAAEEAASATNAAEEQLPDFLKNSHFITRQGAALPTDAFVRHLAIAYADDPHEVLADVRAENQRG